MQHLQYNSPMQLYSRETAEEQYKQQAASVPNASNTAPIPLGSGEKQFDPSKSETLKAILEQDKQDQFGKNFFEKVAEAEAPNVPQQRVCFGDIVLAILKYLRNRIGLKKHVKNLSALDRDL